MYSLKKSDDEICRSHSNIKIIDPHNYLLMTLDGKILQGLFEHERLKPTILRTNKWNVSNLSQLKQKINVGLTMTS